MQHPTDRITHTTAFVTPVVEHWLETSVQRAVFIDNIYNILIYPVTSLHILWYLTCAITTSSVISLSILQYIYILSDKPTCSEIFLYPQQYPYLFCDIPLSCDIFIFLWIPYPSCDVSTFSDIPTCPVIFLSHVISLSSFEFPILPVMSLHFLTSLPVLWYFSTSVNSLPVLWYPVFSCAILTCPVIVSIIRGRKYSSVCLSFFHVTNQRDSR